MKFSSVIMTALVLWSCDQPSAHGELADGAAIIARSSVLEDDRDHTVGVNVNSLHKGEEQTRLRKLCDCDCHTNPSPSPTASPVASSKGGKGGKGGSSKSSKNSKNSKSHDDHMHIS